MLEYDRNVRRDDQCSNTDKEVLSMIEDWQCGDSSTRLEILLMKAAEDRAIPTDSELWVIHLAERCGRKI